MSRTIPFHRAFVFLAAVLFLGVGGTGCAFRATRDFGPQSTSTHESVSAGIGPGFRTLGGDGPGASASDAGGGPPTSTDAGTLGAGGIH